MYSNRRPSPPPRGSVPLSRSRTSSTLPPSSGTQRYFAKSPFVDDLYTPSSRGRTSPSSSSASRGYTSSPSRATFDDLPLHLSSRLNDSREYMSSTRPYRPSSAGGHYESSPSHRTPTSAYGQATAGHSSRMPRSDYAQSHSSALTSNGVTSTLDPYVKEFETVYRSTPSPTLSFNKYKTSTLNPRDYTSTSYRADSGRDVSPSSYRRQSPIPGYRPSSEFRSSPLGGGDHSPIRPRSPSGYTPAHSSTLPSHTSGYSTLSSPVSSTVPSSPTPESAHEYKSLASRVFSPENKPDSNLLDLDLDSKALIAAVEKTNRSLGSTVNQSAKMLHDMDEKLSEIELRRKRREASRTPEKVALDLSVGLAATPGKEEFGRKSPSHLSPEYKERIDRESRSRERTPILASERTPIGVSDRASKVDENANYVKSDSAPEELNEKRRDAKNDKERQDIGGRKESVFEVEINNERQVLDAVSKRRKNDSKSGDAKDSVNANDSNKDKSSNDNKSSESRVTNETPKSKETPIQETPIQETPIQETRKNSNEQGIESRTESAAANQEVESSSSQFNCCLPSFADAPPPSTYDESRRWSVSKKVSLLKLRIVPQLFPCNLLMVPYLTFHLLQPAPTPAKYNSPFVILVAVVALVILVVVITNK